MAASVLVGRLRVLLVCADGATAGQVKRALRSLRTADLDVDHVLGGSQARTRLQQAAYDVLLVALGPAEELAASRAEGPAGELLGAAAGLPVVLLLERAPQEAAAGRLLEHAHAFVIKSEATPGALAGAIEVALRQHRLQARLRSVLEASPDGLLVLDTAGRVLYANAAAGVLLGQTPAALVGTAPALPQVAGTGTAELLLGGRQIEVRRSTLPPTDEATALITLRDVTAVKAREAELAFAAEHDPLTGLANATRLRHELRAALARSARDATRLAVLYLDMDGFKAVNDLHGHETGDALLRELGERLATGSRQGEVIGRIGGDEFAVVAENVPPGAETRIAERLLDIAAQPLLAASRPVQLSMSIGIAIAPDDGHEVEALLRAADSAMYAAKREGRNTFRRVGEAQQALRRRQALADALRTAVLKHEFEVVYQPMFELARGEVVGIEALLRWRRQPDVIESPAAFLEVAEQTGLIIQLGDLVAEGLCRQWVRARWATGRTLRLGLNLSARELQTAGTFARLRRVLIAHGVPTECLSLEVRESVLVREMERVLAQTAGLDGASLAVGDLSGEALSVHRLATLPVGVLKLSRQLVHGLDDDGPQASIIAGMFALARALDLEVVAEGVETAAQAARLRAHGCQVAQGFYYSPPLTEPALLDCLVRPTRLSAPLY